MEPRTKWQPLDELTLLREDLLSSTDARDIQHLEKEALLELQAKFGLGREWGVLDFPAEWMSDGSMKSRGQRVLYIRKICHAEEGSSQAELVTMTVTRYALICLVTPMEGASGVRYLAPSTVVSGARRLCQVIAELGKNNLIADERIFAKCSKTKLLQACRGSVRVNQINRLIQLVERGYWNDGPDLSEMEEEIQGAESTGQSGGSEEKAEGRKKSARTEAAGPSPYLPLEDELVAELGWRCVWFMRHAEPVLIKCAIELIEHAKTVERNDGSKLTTYQSRKSKAIIKFMKEYEWKFENGEDFEEFPFDLAFSGAGNREKFYWPPRDLSQMKSLLTMAQSMHLAVALLSMAGRVSSILSLDTVSFASKNLASQDIANAQSFKDSDAIGGRVRDWPMPSVLELALEHQKTLVSFIGNLNLAGEFNELAKRPDDNTMWLGIRSGEPVTGGYNQMLVSLIETLGLSSLLKNKRIHAHRFRKTIARLMALAIVGAPKIVMDFFGHENIEMTLSYMLTDPMLRLEMEEVARAQVIMFAKEAITDVDNCGGPAAVALRAAVREERARRGEELGETDITGLADTLTLSGTYWMLVRPGVICTKLPQQSGPCNAKKSQPDAARCKSYCGHRLEMSILRQEVDDCIRIALKEIEKANKEDNEIAVESWRGQVIANLGRFPDLKKKWSKNRVVAALLRADSQRGVHA